MQLDKNAVETALRKVLSFADYDLHKALDEPEDENGDTYTDLVAMFIRAYSD